MARLISSLRSSLLKPIGLQFVLVLFGAYSLFAIQLDSFANDPGVGWHLMSGKWMVENRAIPSIDPFLASPEARSWISDQWLSDLVLYGLWSHGGFPLVYAALIALYLFTYFIILFPAVAKASGTHIGACLAVLAAFKLGQIHFILRPVMVGFLFFTIQYSIVSAWYRRCQKPHSAAVLGKLEIIGLPVLFCVWCNMHPSFVIGLLLFAVMIATIVFDRFYRAVLWDHESRQHALRNCCILMLVCGAATLLNPYGWNLHRSIIALGSSDFFMKFHQEWRSPDFRSPEGAAFQLVLYVIVAALFLNSGERKRSLFGLLALITFSSLTLKSVRMLPYFGIALSAMLAESLILLRPGALAPWGARLLSALGRLDQREERSNKGYVLTAVIAAIGVLSALLNHRLPLYNGDFGPRAADYPYGAMRFLREQATDSSPQVVSASPDWGGFITWQGEGRFKPIIDDRNTLLGEAFYQSYIKGLQDREQWRNYLESFKVRYLLVGPEQGFTRRVLESPQVKELYRDKVSVLIELQ